MLENIMAIIAATATKTAVQAPWSERALNAIEMLSTADPPVNIQSCAVLDYFLGLGREKVEVNSGLLT